MLLAFVVMLTVREPPRRGLSRAPDAPASAGSLAPFMRTNARTLGSILAAFSLGGTCCTLALAALVWGRAAYRDSVRRAEQWRGRRAG